MHINYMVKSLDPNSVIDVKELQPTNWKIVSNLVAIPVSLRNTSSKTSVWTNLLLCKVSFHEENPLMCS